jgi:hypothetical protein
LEIVVSRISYLEAIQRCDVLSKLSEYDPHIAGTPPLGLDLPTSDIDILCHAPDPDRFTTFLRMAFGSHGNFQIGQGSGADRPVIASFFAEEWCFEIFGQPKPVAEQLGWRHFLVERRLLALGGRRLTEKVMALRRDGLKTEPAFAAALKLDGDPYQALLEIEQYDDPALLRKIAQSSGCP